MIKKSLPIKLLLLLISWSLAWYPISQLFRNHPQFPTAFFAPLIAFNGIFRIDSLQRPIFQEITLPWLVYWAVLISMAYVIKKKHGKMGI